MIYPEDWEAALASAQKQMEAGNTKELEYRIIRKDGTVLHVLDKGQRIVNDCGEESFYCILIDMTSQKRGRKSSVLVWNGIKLSWTRLPISYSNGIY